MLHIPESIIASIFPNKSEITCSAFVGLGLPERFAEGAASGQPASLIIFRATTLSGSRIATESSPPLIMFGIAEDFLNHS